MDQRLMGGDKDLHDARRLDQIQIVGQGQRHTIIKAGQFGIGPAAGNAHHPVAYLIAGHIADLENIGIAKCVELNGFHWPPPVWRPVLRPRSPRP
ncbi:MAG: hypothetical protein ABT10_18615 [Novosphingobium sp. SCN 63-17]|nr:MAG: hypothetical protein ABT10_18615 [Novosphingobium sp. SCN 63-17]OJX94905.1 MAG: hypothetical protein BGP00_08305 [Novosphingobium sp. 63-713]